MSLAVRSLFCADIANTDMKTALVQKRKMGRPARATALNRLDEDLFLELETLLKQSMRSFSKVQVERNSHSSSKRSLEELFSRIRQRFKEKSRRGDETIPTSRSSF